MRTVLGLFVCSKNDAIPFKVQVKQRYVQAAVLFFLLGVSYVLRINFALLLTQMVFIPHTFEFDEVNDDSFEDLFCPVKMPENDTAVDKKKMQTK